MLLVGQHVIAAEKSMKQSCKSTSAIHNLCSCEGHSKHDHTSKKQICLLHILQYIVSCILKPIHGRRDHLPNRSKVWNSLVQFLFVSLCHLSFEKTQLFMVLIPHRLNPLHFVWGNPCIACLSFWLKAFRTESRTFRGCFNQPKEWCFTGIYGQFEIAKHQNLQTSWEKNTNNKTRSYWSSLILYIYLSRSCFTMRNFIYITSNYQTIFSFPGVASLKLFLH